MEEGRSGPGTQFSGGEAAGRGKLEACRIKQPLMARQIMLACGRDQERGQLQLSLHDGIAQAAYVDVGERRYLGNNVQSVPYSEAGIHGAIELRGEVEKTNAW